MEGGPPPLPLRAVAVNTPTIFITYVNLDCLGVCVALS